MNKELRMFLILLLFCIPQEIWPQTFSKVTDPTNPVVTDEFESGGGTWFDFNNDGYLDLFVANGNVTNVNNSLYLNLKNGNFNKITTGSIVLDGGSSIGGTVGDYNSDGKPDLFVTNRQNFGNFLYQGTGDSIFTKITSGSPVIDISNSNSSSWVDIDNDGDLDLFTVNFQGNNFLYVNSGLPNYAFTKIDTGIIVSDGNNFSIPGLWADYNNDRSPDLFIGNAGTQNDVLYTNHGKGNFSATVFPDGKATLGGSWGDYDNDGDLDLFVSNFSNQKSFIYRNNGAPDFAFIRLDTGIVSNDPGNSVGSVWCDIDNDGDLDLFVANDGQNNFLYLNSGYPDYYFTKVVSGIVVTDGGNSFGCSAADYDNDGDLDLFVANRLNQKNFLYANNGNANNWSTIRLAGTTSNKSAIGTKIRIKAIINGNSFWQTQEVMGQTGYNSQNLWLHFGLGNATMIDSVKIEWTSGTTEYFSNQPVNKFITYVEGSGPLGVSQKAIGEVNDFHLFQNYPNPFNPATNISYQLPISSHVTLKIFDALGREVAALVNEIKEAGNYSVAFNAYNLPSGLYFYTLNAGNYVATKKLLLLK